MSTPRTITVHGIECEVPDCYEFHCDGDDTRDSGNWFMGLFNISDPLSCAFAAAYWHMRHHQNNKPPMQPVTDNWAEYRKCESQMVLWQRAFEVAREGNNA